MIQQPCPSQDWEVIAVIDNEIQRLATSLEELPAGPARENPSRRIVRLQGIMERYISQHSTAGWPSFYPQQEERTP